METSSTSSPVWRLIAAAIIKPPPLFRPQLPSSSSNKIPQTHPRTASSSANTPGDWRRGDHLVKHMVTAHLLDLSYYFISTEQLFCVKETETGWRVLRSSNASLRAQTPVWLYIVISYHSITVTTKDKLLNDNAQKSLQTFQKHGLSSSARLVLGVSNLLQNRNPSPDCKKLLH